MMNDHPLLLKMLEIQTYLNRDRVQECWNDLKYYRDEIRALFRRNQVSGGHRTVPSVPICI